MSAEVSNSDHEWTPKVQTATTYLETLNPEQRRAVEHGTAGGLAAPPLLVIAGGSGKTNTLAHRVAHLIVDGAGVNQIYVRSPTGNRLATANAARSFVSKAIFCASMMSPATRGPDGTKHQPMTKRPAASISCTFVAVPWRMR